jgi:hypothetical protein
MPGIVPRGHSALTVVAAIAAGCASTAPPALDADTAAIQAMVARGRTVVANFFGAPMPHAFDLHVFPHRTGMLQFVQQKWQVSELPCWAVAMGSGSVLLVLSPAAWPAEACEHDPADRAATERIVAHELVHVFHGQHRVDAEFDHADDIAWFVEGLAVLASGQLDAAREQQAREVVAAGKGPTGLAAAWTGPARYAIAGTMARLVDERLGRARLVQLLDVSTTRELLAALGMTEAEFLAAWRSSLSG